jgi:hypothetical protein
MAAILGGVMEEDFTEVDEASRRVYALVQGLKDDGISGMAILSALAGAVIELGDGSEILDSMKFAMEMHRMVSDP